MVSMRPRALHLTSADARALQAAEQQTRDVAYRTRLRVVRLYGPGYPTEQITAMTSAHRSSLMLWCRSYRTGGIAALADQRAGGASAKLTRDQVADLRVKLRQSMPRSLLGPDVATPDGQAWSVDDLRRAVDFWYGVTCWSVVSYDNLFRRCASSSHRPSKVFRITERSRRAGVRSADRKN